MVEVRRTLWYRTALPKGTAYLLVFLFSLSVRAENVFRLHFFSEPQSLLPAAQKNSNAGYVLAQLLMPLLYWEDGKLEPGLAKECHWSGDKTLVCTFPKDLKYSDGSPLGLADIAKTYNDIVAKPSSFAQSDELNELAKVETNKNEVRFTLKRKNREFIYVVANPLFSPIKKVEKSEKDRSGYVGTGPYRIEYMVPGQKIRLQPNPFALASDPRRPPVEAFFISEDSIALRMYEKGELSFLRRLPAVFIPKYKDSKDFFFIEQIRFDYFGFSKKMREQKNSLALRQALALAIPYSELQALYHAKPRPGCFGLPTELSDGQVCFDADLAKAKSLSKEIENKDLRVTFSSSVEDHRRSVEWLQDQFKKNIGLHLIADGAETKIFLQRLEDREASFFRRGVAPSRPTCAAVLETFLAGAPDNYLDLDLPKLSESVRRLRESEDPEKKAKICREALLNLRDEFVMIPMGPISFAILAKPEWQGWKLNSINELDLRHLHQVPPSFFPFNEKRSH